MISYSQNLEDVLLSRALSHVRCGFYVDVGANDPIKASVSYAFYERGWSGLNIEPVEEFAVRLKAHRPRDETLCLAVSDKRSIEKFYEIPNSGLSTLRCDVIAPVHSTEIVERVVHIYPLKEIFSERNIDVIHFLKVDVEGAEAEVLRGCDFSTHRPWIILVEATKPGTQIPSYHAWEDILLEAGYEFVYYDGLNRFYISAEQASQLQGFFQFPVNAFDNYVRFSEVMSNVRADEAVRSSEKLFLQYEALQRRLTKAASHTEELGMIKAYNHYRHALCMAYTQYGFVYQETEKTIPRYADLLGLPLAEIIRTLTPSVKLRLNQISEDFSSLIDRADLRMLDTGRGEIAIPLLNQQGVDWYGDSPLSSYDFMQEYSLGLLDGSEVIYDLGGHHGVWSAFYAKISRGTNVVHYFEPSIVNFEIAAMLMFINGISNVSLQPFAVAANVPSIDSSVGSSGLLVDFVAGNFLIIDFNKIAWQWADFIKVDIEGYEYDLITNYPWIFESCRNMHLELHIPHLQARGLDYRRVLECVPFDDFKVFNCVGATCHEIDANTDLSGFCSLMLRRR